MSNTRVIMTHYKLLNCLIIAASFTSICALGEGKRLELTAQEFDANRDYVDSGGKFLTRSIETTSPKIIVDKPSLEKDVVLPVDIDVRFEAAADSPIDISSLRVKYGWFDITERAREFMEVSEQGITGKIDGFREGKYTIKLIIRDQKKRTAQTEISFNVGRLSH